MRSKVIALIVSLSVLMLIVVPFMTACGGEQTTEAQTTEAQTPEAQTPEVIELTFGTPLPEGESPSIGASIWMEKIEEATNGQVHFTPYYGGILIGIAEGFKEIVEGVADCGYVMVTYSPGGFPIVRGEQAFYYGCPDMDTIVRVYNEVHSKYPIDSEWDQVKILSLAVSPLEQLHTIKGPIHTLDDMKGLIIRSHLTPEVCKKMGIALASVPASDLYIALEKGTIDGCLFAWTAIKTLRLAEVTKYHTTLNNALGPFPAIIMNLNTWNSLPKDIQEVFEEATDWYISEYTKLADAMDQESIDFGKEMGCEFDELTQEALNEFYEILESEAIKEAEKLDAEGLPGTEIFNETRRLIEEYTS